MDDYFLNQYFNFPRRLRGCDQQSPLGMVFATQTNMVDKFDASCSLWAGDHVSLNITLALCTRSSINRPSLDYINGDFGSLRLMIIEANLKSHVQACDAISDN